jgi:hypothetical protein
MWVAAQDVGKETAFFDRDGQSLRASDVQIGNSLTANRDINVRAHPADWKKSTFTLKRGQTVVVADLKTLPISGAHTQVWIRIQAPPAPAPAPAPTPTPAPAPPRPGLPLSGEVYNYAEVRSNQFVETWSSARGGAIHIRVHVANQRGGLAGRSPVLDIGRREFITLLGGAAIFVYLLSRTFFPMAVRTYSSC